MTKNEKFLIVLIGIVFALLFVIVIIVGLNGRNKDQFSVRYVQNYVDPETGVNYIFYHDPTTGTVTISVRYNEEGGVMITPIKEGVSSDDIDEIDENLATNG